MSGAADQPAAVRADQMHRVDVLIVNYNSGAWLARAVESVRPGGACAPGVIVVDNGSSDGSLDALEPAALAANQPTGAGSGICMDQVGFNSGFAAGVNRAAGHASREFLLILNPDCLIGPPALARLVDELDRHPEAALVSGRVLESGGSEQRGSRRRLPTPSRILNEMLPLGGEGVDATHTRAPGEPIEVEAVSGACMLIRRRAFRELGGMDEDYPLHFEDLDLFARLAEHGKKLRWVPEAKIVHAGGRSSGRRPVAVLWAKHRGLWRYLNRHCGSDWPRWQRPFWALAMLLSATARTPLVWAAARLRRKA